MQNPTKCVSNSSGDRNSRGRHLSDEERREIQRKSRGYENYSIIEEHEEKNYIDKKGSLSGSETPTSNQRVRLTNRNQPKEPSSGRESSRARVRVRRSQLDESFRQQLLQVQVSLGDPGERYEGPLEALGKGATSLVYKFKQRLESEVRYVAIKQMNINSLRRRSNLLAELNILRKLAHPNIVSYYESYLVRESHLWVVMEYADAGTLTSLIREFDLNLITDPPIILNEIVKALDFLHSNHIIHRDLKSNNVVLKKDGQIKLIDFGFGAQLENFDDKRSTEVGSPYWTSPEILNSQSYDNKTDIWSLGIIVHELVFGRPPYFESNRQDASELIRRNGKPQVDSSQMPKDLKSFYDCCLDVEPKWRWSAKKLLTHDLLRDVGPTSLLIPYIRQYLAH